jgi:hypothetical protein
LVNKKIFDALRATDRCDRNSWRCSPTLIIGHSSTRGGLNEPRKIEKHLGLLAKCFFLLVGAGRFELPTPTTPLPADAVHPQYGLDGSGHAKLLDGTPEVDALLLPAPHPRAARSLPAAPPDEIEQLDLSSLPGSERPEGHPHRPDEDQDQDHHPARDRREQFFGGGARPGLKHSILCGRHD